MSDNRIIGEFVSATEPTADELNRLAVFFEKKLNSPVTLNGSKTNRSQRALYSKS